MNENHSTLIYHALDIKTTIVSIYINDFLLASNCLNILNILKETLG